MRIVSKRPSLLYILRRYSQIRCASSSHSSEISFPIYRYFHFGIWDSGFLNGYFSLADASAIFALVHRKVGQPTLSFWKKKKSFLRKRRLPTSIFTSNNLSRLSAVDPNLLHVDWLGNWKRWTTTYDLFPTLLSGQMLGQPLGLILLRGVIWPLAENERGNPRLWLLLLVISEHLKSTFTRI